LTQMMTTALLRAADAPVLPFEFGQVVTAVKGYLEDLKNKELELDALKTELGKLQVAAEEYESVYKKALDRPAVQTRLNRILIGTERALLNPAGLPGRPWYKHQLMAPGLYTGYSAKTLPGIREAAEAQRWTEANREAGNVTQALRALRLKLEEASSLLAE
jgi:N-acetylated-alpha-linked acidic dipeptidase